MTRPRPSAWIPPLLALGALVAVAACATPHVDPDQPKSAQARAFRDTHLECNPRMYRTPCQIGPDGRLYEYNPDERGQR